MLNIFLVIIAIVPICVAQTPHSLKTSSIRQSSRFLAEQLLDVNFRVISQNETAETVMDTRCGYESTQIRTFSASTGKSVVFHIAADLDSLRGAFLPAEESISPTAVFHTPAELNMFGGNDFIEITGDRNRCNILASDAEMGTIQGEKITTTELLFIKNPQEDVRAERQRIDEEDSMTQVACVGSSQDETRTSNKDMIVLAEPDTMGRKSQVLTHRYVFAGSAISVHTSAKDDQKEPVTFTHRWVAKELPNCACKLAPHKGCKKDLSDSHSFQLRHLFLHFQDIPHDQSTNDDVDEIKTFLSVCTPLQPAYGRASKFTSDFRSFLQQDSVISQSPVQWDFGPRRITHHGWNPSASFEPGSSTNRVPLLPNMKVKTKKVGDNVRARELDSADTERWRLANEVRDPLAAEHQGALEKLQLDNRQEMQRLMQSQEQAHRDIELEYQRRERDLEPQVQYYEDLAREGTSKRMSIADNLDYNPPASRLFSTDPKAADILRGTSTDLLTGLDDIRLQRIRGRPTQVSNYGWAAAAQLNPLQMSTSGKQGFNKERSRQTPQVVYDLQPLARKIENHCTMFEVQWAAEKFKQSIIETRPYTHKKASTFKSKEDQQHSLGDFGLTNLAFNGQ